jgi:hypothetical protein
MTRRWPVLGLALAMSIACWAQEPSVQVRPPDLHGSRELDPSGVTEKAVIRDYLESWQSMRKALDTNQPSLLSPEFVGTAHDKLADVIAQQTRIGIHTRYVDRSHDLQIVFYSPEGLSIQLIDNVTYDEQVMQGGTVLASQPIRARYLAVLTPTDVRWTVRIFQPDLQATNANDESSIKRHEARRTAR